MSAQPTGSGRPADGSDGLPVPDSGYSRRIAVVAVTYSPGETLHRFLDSIPAAGSWQTGEPMVVLADNGSTDGSVEAAEHRPGVTLLRTGANLGFGGGANAGIRVVPADVPWVLVCNPDIEFAPGAIDALLDAAERWPTGGAFGPQLRTPDDEPYPSARELPSLVRGVAHAALGWWWPGNPWTRSYRRDSDAPVEREAGWLSGACQLLRRAAFDAVDGFDERYFMYFEDVDLGERLGRAGWRNVYVPSAVVTHLGGHSTRSSSAAMVAVHHRSAYRYLAGRYGAWWQAPVRWLLRAGLGLRAALASRSTRMSRGAALPRRRSS